jgi:hypothetical protein
LRLPDSGPVVTLGGTTSFGDIGLFIVFTPIVAASLKRDGLGDWTEWKE